VLVEDGLVSDDPKLSVVMMAVSSTVTCVATGCASVF
jgi:hypothetical protein